MPTLRILILRLIKPGGTKAIAAENIMLRQQLISLSRNRKRSPKLNTLDKNYQHPPGSSSPSWLTFLAHAKNSLWSIDFFRCVYLCNAVVHKRTLFALLGDN